MVLSMKDLEIEGYDADEVSDNDTCDQEEIKSLFGTTPKLLLTKTVLENKYILHIDGTNETNYNLAVAKAGNNEIDIYNLNDNQLAKSVTLSNGVEEKNCVGLKFDSDNSNLLFTAHEQGTIKLWDLRANDKIVSEFKDTTAEKSNKMKPFTCFDLAPENRLLAAGTELKNGDAYILFWDVRNVNLLGGYWESHTDDITKLDFHPDDKNKLISASTDGLLNIYDLSKTCEDDALLDSLNSESSIELAEWFKTTVFCSTHTFDVQFWRLEDAEPYAEFKRDVLGDKIKKKNGDFIYVANAHSINEEIILFLGTNFKDGECFRGLSLRKNELKPKFEFVGNSQRVRSSWFNEQSNTLVTGGEKGILNIWKLTES